MASIAVGEVFVSLITYVVDAVLGAEGVDCSQRGFRIYGARRVVGRNGHDSASAGRDRGAEGLEVQLAIAVGRREHRASIGHGDGHLMIEIIWDRENDLVARVEDPEDNV